MVPLCCADHALLFFGDAAGEEQFAAAALPDWILCGAKILAAITKKLNPTDEIR